MIKSKASSMRLRQQASPEMLQLLRDVGSSDYRTSMNAQNILVKALEMPLRQGVLEGDIVGSSIFQEVYFAPGTHVEYPKDLLAPGAEKRFKAFTVPNTGLIPKRAVEGDYIAIQTYDVGNGIQWSLKYMREARWDIVSRAMEILEAGFIMKKNDDCWHTLLASGDSRNLVIYDANATAGLFTKGLVSNMKINMQRLAGGNSASKKKGKLTDLFLSPEGHEDINSWDLTQVDDQTRRAIFLNFSEGGLSRIGDVTLHALLEFGDDQEYQLYFENELEGTLPGSKLELVVGLDLSRNDSFILPFRQEIEIFEDIWLHRENAAGAYARREHGVAALDNRAVLLGAF